MKIRFAHEMKSCVADSKNAGLQARGWQKMKKQMTSKTEDK